MFKSRRRQLENERYFVIRRHNRTASIPEDVKGIDGVIEYLKSMSESGKIEDYEIVINFRGSWEVYERRELERLKEKYESEKK